MKQRSKRQTQAKARQNNTHKKHKPPPLPLSRRNTPALTQSDATLVNAGLFLEFTESTIIWVYIKNGAVVSGLKVGVIIVYGILGGPRGMVWLQLQPFQPAKT